MTDLVCPICHSGVLARAEGRLDQSGDSYLPTVVWRCARCEYTRYEPATTAHWLPERAPAEPAAPAAVTDPAAAPTPEPAAGAEPAPATPRRAA